MLLKACLNGGRPAPATPAELAAEAAASVEAGAGALHVHPRDPAGRESLAAADVAATLTAIRAACPGVPVGVSTGIWMTHGDAARRASLIAGWTRLPDFASVNVHEKGFAELVRRLHDAGVGVEAGVWRPAEVGALDGLPFTRVLIEIVGAPGAPATPSAGPGRGAAWAVTAADAILAGLDEAGIPGERLLHGEEEACWPLVAHAARLGLSTRIGLEDTLLMPDGTPASGNAALVEAALRIRGSEARHDARPGS